MPSPTFPALTALRFLAALLVFLFHFPLPGSLFDVVAREGHVGVNIFFVLSGFLITLRYADGVGRGAIGLGGYFIRRAARILPLYYVVFILSVPFTGSHPLFSMARLPEWTLTQGLFRDSVGDLAVPTSWSLTVEECFYALAPLLFLLIAGAQRAFPQKRLLAALLAVAMVTVILYGAGAAIWTALDGRGPGFLSTAEQVSRNTLFGRFYDFALGAGAALVYASRPLRWHAFFDRPLRGLAASGIAVGLVMFAQWRMHLAGGINGATWRPVYAWHLLIAPAAALLIASLTSASNPVTRLLSRAPFVYLGKVSYALYLVQATELAKSTAYRLLPDESVVCWAALYVGMTLVCIALYELVEEPGRRLVLRVTGLERRGGEGLISGPMARLAVASLIAIGLLGAGTAWTMRALRQAMGTVTLAEIEAIGPSADDILRVDRDALEPGKGWSIKLPRRWRDGWRDDDRAPTDLRVFVDGAGIPFSPGEPAPGGPAAFFRSARSSFLALRLDAQPQKVVVINDGPGLETRVFVRRLAHSPRHAVFLGACVLASLAMFGVLVRARRRPPQTIDPRDGDAVGAEERRARLYR